MIILKSSTVLKFLLVKLGPPITHEIYGLCPLCPSLSHDSQSFTLMVHLQPY